MILQVAKLDPVSTPAGMDCEYPLDTAGMYAVCINILTGMGFTNERKEI